MSNPSVEMTSPVLDRVRVVVALSVVLAGIVAWYVLSSQPLAVRLGSLLLALIVGLAVGWGSQPGRRLVGFAREAWAETRRVVWPARKDAWMVTLYVFAFVVVMALFLWVVDKTLEWVLYDLVLGWKR
jgi:preprotein translocase subunit SecE